MRRIILHLVVYLGCLAACAAACLAAPDQRSIARDAGDYANKVIAADKLAGDFVAPEGLLGFEPFIQLADEAATNIDGCIQFLAEQRYTPQQRMIAIRSMHRLGVHEYVIFLRKLADLFDKGLVSSNELGSAVAPTYAFSTVLIENYAESDVQSALREIAERKGIRPATKSVIESNLSGKALKDWLSFRRDCCSGPDKK